MLTWTDIAAIAIAFSLSIYLIYFGTKSGLDDLRRPPGAAYLEGHMRLMFDIKDGLAYLEHLADEYGHVVKVKGLFGTDQLWVSDPLALEHILLKAPCAWDANYLFTDLMYLLFGRGLMSSSGAQHKKQRRLLNPMFSGHHVSNIVPLYYQIGRQLRHKLLEEIGTKPSEIDLLDWMGRTTMEFIGQGGLGYQFGALEGRRSEYRDALRLLLPTLARTGALEEPGIMLSRTGPAWFRRLIVNLTPVSAVQELKRIVDIMHRTSTNVFQERKQRLARDGGVAREESGTDVLSRLVYANSRVAEEHRLSDDEAIAQLSTLMFAANDTTAGALCRVFQLLATHPDIQTKLRTELEHANADMDMTYDQLMSLPFLDAVCKETLRLHPPVTTVSRRSQQDDILPLLHPVTSRTGHPVTKIAVPKGTKVWVAISSANQSKAIWGDNAREWVPERWLTSGHVGRARLPGAFASMMTFMGGERGCIGYRMAVLELKIVLSVLLPAFRFEPGSKPVVWRLGATLAPFVQGGEGEHDIGPEMPMRLSRV